MKRLILLGVLIVSTLSACTTPSQAPADVKSVNVAQGDSFQVRSNTTQQKWVNLTVTTTNPPTFSGRTLTVKASASGWTVYDGNAIFFFVKTNGESLTVYDTEEGAGWFLE